MSYYDIDDILAETRKVPCIWHVDAFGLGELDPSADSSQRDVRTIVSPHSAHQYCDYMYIVLFSWVH